MKNVFVNTCKSIANSIKSFICKSLIPFSYLLECLLSYVMLFMGEYLFCKRDTFMIGGEIAIPIVVGLVIWFIRQSSIEINTVSQIPIPSKRFTEDDGYGEITVREDRLQEMILYLADVEDYLERKDLM